MSRACRRTLDNITWWSLPSTTASSGHRQHVLPHLPLKAEACVGQPTPPSSRTKRNPRFRFVQYYPRTLTYHSAAYSAFSSPTPQLTTQALQLDEHCVAARPWILGRCATQWYRRPRKPCSAYVRPTGHTGKAAVSFLFPCVTHSAQWPVFKSTLNTWPAVDVHPATKPVPAEPRGQVTGPVPIRPRAHVN